MFVECLNNKLQFITKKINNFVDMIEMQQAQKIITPQFTCVKKANFFLFQLFGSILESFRKQFGLATDVHIILFPYALYPFTQIAITGSIFMTVAIALERFIAVHYPLDYSQAMHEANALTKRIVKYVSVVIFLSLGNQSQRLFILCPFPLPCSRNFQSVKLRLDFVEIYDFT